MQAIGSALPGIIQATITNGRGHDPRTWAEMAANKIMFVSDQAPQPIRDQAYAFKAQVREAVAFYISQALHEQLVYLVNDLAREGMHEAAEMVRSRSRTGV